MATIRQRWIRRSTLGIGAAIALIVATAGPASADLPNNVSLDGTVEDGAINVNSRTFDLGDDEPDPCNPDEDPATISADAGSITGGIAPIDNVVVTFPAGNVVDDPEEDPICATIVITNQANIGGTQSGAAADDTGQVALDDDGIVVMVDFDLLDCAIGPIQMPGGAPIDLAGSIDDQSGSGGPWTLDLDAEPGFNVPFPSGALCNFLGAASQISTELGGLPTTTTSGNFVFELDD